VIDASLLLLVLVAVTAWLNAREKDIVAGLIEENRLVRRVSRERTDGMTDYAGKPAVDLTGGMARWRIHLMVVLRTGRLVALIAAALMISSPLVSCLAAASSDAEMACCVKGSPDCLPGTKVADCCTLAPTQVSQQATVAAKTTPLTQVAVGEILPVLVATSTAWRSHPYVDGLSPPGCKHPTYLLLSTFRL
jgi:hypothetical protein